MQKLERRDTYTPLDASQVQCNCDYALNKVQNEPSVHSLKTLSNNSDVNQPVLCGSGTDDKKSLSVVKTTLQFLLRLKPWVSLKVFK
jgi:hypothetical protein